MSLIPTPINGERIDDQGPGAEMFTPSVRKVGLARRATVQFTGPGNS